MTIKVFHPNSRLKILWEIYILIITVVMTVVAPLYIIFGVRDSPGFIFLDILITVSYVADIAIQFNTGFLVRHKVVTDRKIIARRYLRSWFILDVLAAIPFLWMLRTGRLVQSSVLRYFRLARLLKLIGTVKTLRRARTIPLFNPGILRLIMLVFWILIAAHMIACSWIFIGGAPIQDPARYTYIKAFYWTVTTLTTIGYGDIVPKTPNQTVFVIVIQLIGAAIYGVIIGNIANIIANIDVAKTQFREKMENINTFLKYRDIPQDLTKRIHNYYDYLWETRRGYEEADLLQDLPMTLKTQVALFLNKEIIEKVPIFKSASQEFIRDVILNLKPTVYTPGDAVISQGEIGFEMYFISQGSVDVTNADGTLVYATLSTGQFFGEIALLLSTPRTATVKARDYCDLYILDKDTFDNILQRYPRFAKNVEEHTDQRRKELGLEKDEEEYIEILEDVTTSSSGPVPVAPEAVVHQLLEDDIVKLSWIPLSGADSYEVIRKSEGENRWLRLSSTLRNPVYLDLHAPAGTNEYMVRGNNRHGPGRWSDPVVVKPE